MNYTTRIALTGGGTGGHIYPLLAVADAVRAAQPDAASCELHYFGPASSFDSEFRTRGIALHPISSSKLRRYISIQNILDIPKFFWSFFQAFAKLYAVMPDVLFSKGGPGALPVVFAAWFYRIPVLVHDSDSVPGLTTRLSAKFAKRIAISFPNAAIFFPKAKIAFTGNPIRPELFTAVPDSATAKHALGFDPAISLIVVFGGSQGSTRVNAFIAENLPAILEKAQVFHQTGLMNNWNVEEALAEVPEAFKARYRAAAVLDADMVKTALSALDIAIARAGAGTIYELAGFKKPAILIPLKGSAGDHQRLNATAYSEAGAAIVLEENNLTRNVFLSELSKLLDDPALRAEMGERAGAFFKPEAAATLANALLTLAG